MNSTILYKYFNHQASEEEVALLFKWIEESPDHKRKFIRLKAAYAMATSAEIEQVELDRRRSEIKLPKNQFKPWRYAAIFILMLAVGSFWYTFTNSKEVSQEPLVLEINDSHEIINLEEVTVINSTEGTPLARFSGDQLTYLSQTSTTAITQQFIKVPYGKTLKVKLPDQTLVTLNAGSTLKFPSRFEGPQREVTLTGEGFFDVTKNKKQPFKVRARNLNIEVLGTRFNVQAYPEENTVQTALEEGSVSLSHTGNPLELLLLSPGEMATYHMDSQELNKKQVNIEQKIAWTRGELLLDHTKFPVLLKTLERHFNIEVVSTYPELEKESFSGTVKLDLGIEEILQLLQLDTDFQYSLEENELTLTKPETK